MSCPSAHRAGGSPGSGSRRSSRSTDPRSRALAQGCRLFDCRPCCDHLQPHGLSHRCLGDAVALEETFTALINESFDIALLVLDFPTGEAPEAWWTACRASQARATPSKGSSWQPCPRTCHLTPKAKVREYGLVPMLGLNETMEAIATLGSSSTSVVASPHTPGRRNNRDRSFARRVGVKETPLIRRNSDTDRRRSSQMCRRHPYHFL